MLKEQFVKLNKNNVTLQETKLTRLEQIVRKILIELFQCLKKQQQLCKK